MTDSTAIEAQRQTIQRKLDSQKSQEERNSLGQFSTPNALARAILEYAETLVPQETKIRFFDPAFGTGSFFSALNDTFAPEQIEVATGYEIDEHYGKPAQELWSQSILNCHLEDFTKAPPPKTDQEKFNLVICNPPYVRHHSINGDKSWLRAEAFNAAKMKLSGLSGLYCYFLALAHSWMQPDAIAGWLIPSEFMDVNYGQGVKDYLLNEVSLLQIHRFDPQKVQFDDALVSSAVVWFKNEKPSANHQVRFSFGGTLHQPTCEKMLCTEVLEKEKKWTRFPLSSERKVTEGAKLGDFFTVKRGIATGDNQFFILSKGEIEERGLPISQFRPILPSPRHLLENKIETDLSGSPTIENPLFVLDCKFSFEEVEQRYPKLYDYLQTGLEQGVAERYLCRKRKLWYFQEKCKASPFYCTYIGRSDKKGKKTFRFILNHSNAIVSNSYLILHPKPQLETLIAKSPKVTSKIIELLREITNQDLLNEGRVYGGGMHKLEPKELSNVTAQGLLALVANPRKSFF